MTVDVLSVVEAAYRFDVPDDIWLRDLAAAIYSQVGAGLGLMAFPYHVTPELRVEIGETVALDMPREVADATRTAMASLPPSYVSKTFVRCECVTQSQGGDAAVREYNRPI